MDVVYQAAPTKPAQAMEQQVPATKQPAAPAIKAGSSEPREQTQAPVPATHTSTSQPAQGSENPLAASMTPLLWIAFGFVAGLVIILAISLWVPTKRGSTTKRVIQFLMSLCGGMAGAFFTGSALFSAAFTEATGKFTISGAAGCAIFMMVWYGYRLVPDDADYPVEVASIDMPPDWTFKQVADGIVGKLKSGVNYDGLSDNELNAQMKNQSLEADSWRHLLESLGSATVSQSVRPYSVEKKGNTYWFKV